MHSQGECERSYSLQDIPEFYPAKVIVSQFTTYGYYNYPRGGEVEFNF
jgi:hypothetical protein